MAEMTDEEKQKLMTAFAHDGEVANYLKSRGVPFSHRLGVYAQHLDGRQYMMAGGDKFTPEQLELLAQAGFVLVGEWWGAASLNESFMMTRRYALLEDVQ